MPILTSAFAFPSVLHLAFVIQPPFFAQRVVDRAVLIPFRSENAWQFFHNIAFVLPFAAVSIHLDVEK
jgi:hypothetical protein